MCARMRDRGHARFHELAAFGQMPQGPNFAGKIWSRALRGWFYEELFYSNSSENYSKYLDFSRINDQQIVVWSELLFAGLKNTTFPGPGFGQFWPWAKLGKEKWFVGWAGSILISILANFACKIGHWCWIGHLLSSIFATFGGNSIGLTEEKSSDLFSSQTFGEIMVKSIGFKAFKPCFLLGSATRWLCFLFYSTSTKLLHKLCLLKSFVALNVLA